MPLNFNIRQIFEKILFKQENKLKSTFNLFYQFSTFGNVKQKPNIIMKKVIVLVLGLVAYGASGFANPQCNTTPVAGATVGICNQGSDKNGAWAVCDVNFEGSVFCYFTPGGGSVELEPNN